MRTVDTGTGEVGSDVARILALDHHNVTVVDNDEVVPRDVLRYVLSFFVLFLGLLFAGTLVVSAMGSSRMTSWQRFPAWAKSGRRTGRWLHKEPRSHSRSL